MLLPAEALHERRRLGRLYGLLRCPGLLYRPRLSSRKPILPGPRQAMSQGTRGPHFCLRIVDGPDYPMPSHGPDRRFVALRILCRCNFSGPHRLGLSTVIICRLGTRDVD